MNDSFENLMQYTKEHFPIMGEAFDLTVKIDRIKGEAKEMEDGFDRQCSFERLCHLDSMRFEKLSLFLVSYCQELPKRYMNIIERLEKDVEKLMEALRVERQTNIETLEGLCMAFTVNPRLAFETILRFVERDEKTKSQDGFENWQWGLHFPLRARLRMAWKLVFGTKDFSKAVDSAKTN